MEHLADLATLGSSLGVERVGFSRLMPRGRGRRMRDAMHGGPQTKERIISPTTRNASSHLLEQGANRAG